MSSGALVSRKDREADVFVALLARTYTVEVEEGAFSDARVLEGQLRLDSRHFPAVSGPSEGVQWPFMP